MKKRIMTSMAWLTLGIVGRVWGAADVTTSPYLSSDLIKPLCSSAVSYTPIKLNRSGFARAVENREPVYPIASGSVLPEVYDWLYFFTEAVDSAGTQIVHNWYHNGRLMLTAPLNIGSNRWRTWSRKWYDGIQSGTWEVLIEDSRGCLLSYSRVDFAENASSKEVASVLSAPVQVGSTPAPDDVPRQVNYAFLTTDIHNNSAVDCVKKLSREYESIHLFSELQGYQGRWITVEWLRNEKLKATHRYKISKPIDVIDADYQFDPAIDNGGWQVRLRDNKKKIIHHFDFSYQNAYGGSLTKPLPVTDCMIKAHQLLTLVQEGASLEKFRAALKTGEVIDVKREDDKEILSTAIEKQLTDVAQFLIEDGYFDVNVRYGYQQETPLLTAVRLHQYDFVRWLLKKGANIHQKTSISQQDSLYVASKEQDKEMIQILLTHGADPNSLTIYEYSPLMIAAEHCDYDVVSLMLAYRADLSFANSEGVSATTLLLKCQDSIAVDGILSKHGVF